MKRSSSRKAAEGLGERRLKGRKESPIRRPREAVEASNTQVCSHCSKDLALGDRALFVEEEVGRTFCEENCISEYFAPEVQRLDSEYHSLVSGSDLKPETVQELSHLKWFTLREPDEVWREKTLSGDYRYTIIGEYRSSDKPVWCVCLSLFLKGEPSFLFLSFITKNASLVDHYRQGERMSWIKRTASEKEAMTNPRPSAEQLARDGTVIVEDELDHGSSEPPLDGLADGWSSDEAMRAAIGAERRKDDISPDEFAEYQSYLEETLEAPEELWSLAAEGEEGCRLYHFIRSYESPEKSFWYVVVARESESQEHLEVVEAFPTRDSELVEKYRQGSQEIGGEGSSEVVNRVLH